MTREEAINHLKTVAKSAIDSGYDSAVVDAVDMAREALEQEPKYCDRNICIRNEHNGIGCGECEVTKSQEPCTDAISRDELLKAMDTWDKFGYTETGCFVREPKNNCVKYIHYDDVIKCIKGMPPVTPQPKTQATSEIDNFVSFLIRENCEGCKECEPRLSADWKPKFACVEEGRAKWLLSMAEKYKAESEWKNDN